MNKKLLIYWPILFGTLGGIILLALYAFTLGIAMSFDYALAQFYLLWRWMTPLIVGFSFQVGLFFYMRGFRKLTLESYSNNKAVITSAGVSTSAMIACCLHHITDVLPIIGLTAASVFLAQYQTVFLAIGISSNLIGLFYVLLTIKKHHLYLENSLFGQLNKIVIRVLLWASTLFGFIWILYLII